MRFYLDTEFVDRGRHGIELISIGVVSQQGFEFYCINKEVMLVAVGDWHWEHVMPHLPPFGSERWDTYGNIGPALETWVNNCIGNGDDDTVEFWAWYADYDFVVMSQLFGPLIHRPKNWPMYCRDLKQYADSLGNPRIPDRPKEFKESIVLGDGVTEERRVHDALSDAWDDLWRHKWLVDYETGAVADGEDWAMGGRKVGI